MLPSILRDQRRDNFMMLRALAVAVLAAFIASTTAQTNVRSICETDADCPIGSRCRVVPATTSPGASLLSLLQGLLGSSAASPSAQSSPTRTCSPEDPAAAATSDKSSAYAAEQSTKESLNQSVQQEQHHHNNFQQSASSIEQSASESVLRDSEDWKRGVSCKQFIATVPLGASLAIGVDQASFFETNFTTSNVEIAVTESRTGKTLTKGTRFTFSCDVTGDFLLYFNVSLRDKDSGELLDDSHMCPAEIHCGEDTLQGAAASVTAANVTQVPILGESSAVPSVVCFDSPVALNTDREVNVGLENVAFALQLIDQITGDSVDKSTAPLVTMIQHLYIPQNSTAADMGSGTSLKFKCSSAGKHIVYIIVSVMNKITGAHDMKICPTTIQCNTASLTANLPLNTFGASPSTSTSAPPTVELSTTTPTPKTLSSVTTTSGDTSLTLLGAAVNESDLNEHAALFDNIRRTFSQAFSSALLFSQVGDTDELEKLLFNSTSSKT